MRLRPGLWDIARAVAVSVVGYLGFFVLVDDSLFVTCHFVRASGETRASVRALSQSGAAQKLLCSELTLAQEFVTSVKTFCYEKDWVGVVVADWNAADVLKSQLCSLRTFPRERFLYVVFDNATKTLVELHGKWALLVSQRRYRPVEKHWFKLLVPLIVLAAGADCFVIDSDVIFLGNFSELWSRDWQMEFASDNMYDLRSSDFVFDGQHEVNSGLVKYKASCYVLQFLETVAMSAPRLRIYRDQSLLNFALNRSIPWRQGWKLNEKLNWSVVEPLKAPNGGVVLCRGREKLRSLAQLEGVHAPLAVHLNYHMPPTGKAVTIRLLGWEVTGGKCPSYDWFLWENNSFAATIPCTGVYIRHQRVTRRVVGSRVRTRTEQ